MVPHRFLIVMAALMVSAVTAHAQVMIKPRSIEPGRIIAAGEFPAAGTAVKPRTFALNGFVAQGSSATVSPRTFRLTGWTASPPPKGGKK